MRHYDFYDNYSKTVLFGHTRLNDVQKTNTNKH